MENDCIAPEGFTSSVGQLLSGEEELARSAGGSQILFSPARQAIRGPELGAIWRDAVHTLLTGSGQGMRVCVVAWCPNVRNVIYDGDWVKKQNIAHENEAN